MAMQHIQNIFSSGELDPGLRARIDKPFYGNGARMSERLGFKGPSPVNRTNTVTMNISKVEVSANNAKEFAESMLKARQNPLSNVAKSIASSVDTKRIA